ncbi:hypothetical protein [Saccharothrix stipae]
MTRDLAAIEEDVAHLDAALEPIAQAPVDISRLDDFDRWVAEMRAEPSAMDQAGVRAEAEAVLTEILARYAEDEAARPALRAMFDRYGSFAWGVHLPSAATPEGGRTDLLHLSVRDHGRDTRDEILRLRDVCDEARRAGVDIGPILREVAAMSSDVDRYGMGSMRALLLAEAGPE